jgi:proteasome lid subunit RPN8/RPN11
MLHLPADLLTEIGRRALAAYPAECCGILLGTRTPAAILIDHALDAPNLADNPKHYTVDPAAILKADKFARDNALEIVGFYHSHPDHPAHPSITDTTLAWDTYVYLIVSVTASTVLEAKAFRFTQSGPHELPLTITDRVAE